MAAMEMMRNVFSSVDCWWLRKEPIVSCVGCEKSRLGLQVFKVMSFCLMLARNRFLHWRTASLMTFCDMLAHMSMRRCCKSLVTAAGIADRCLYNVHTFLHQSTNSVVNRTVWRTQIWRDKVRCFLLKELDCFTSIEWRQNASFPSQIFKSK